MERWEVIPGGGSSGDGAEMFHFQESKVSDLSKLVADCLACSDLYTIIVGAYKGLTTGSASLFGDELAKPDRQGPSVKIDMHVYYTTPPAPADGDEPQG